jgi:hypothetical protein
MMKDENPLMSGQEEILASQSCGRKWIRRTGGVVTEETRDYIYDRVVLEGTGQIEEQEQEEELDEYGQPKVVCPWEMEW